jgi:hypothetical protein
MATAPELRELFKNTSPDGYKSKEEYYRYIAGVAKTSPAYVKKIYLEKKQTAQERDSDQYLDPNISTDKKVGKFYWRDIIEPLKDLQTQFKEAKGSQDIANWNIKTDAPVCVVILGDLHLGSWATDYDMFCEITRELIETPNLYAILVGDLLQMAIKLRGVLEVSDNALPPNIQYMFLESWLKDVKHKVIASTWDNHAVMREENQAGRSEYAEIFCRHTIYHNNIGHLTIGVNEQKYELAVGHFFRGRSMYNPLHGHQRYIREMADEREFIASGDSHVAGIAKWDIGGKTRVALNCGSIQNSGYGKRFFSLYNAPIFPCVTFHHDEHQMTPYWSVKEWLKK